MSMTTEATPSRLGALAVLTISNFCLLALLWGVENLIGERRWWAAFLTYLPQHFLLLPAGVLVLAAAVRRRGRLVLWNLLAACLCAVAFLGVNLPLPRATPDGMRVRVMTYNIHGFSWGTAAIARTIRQEGADIVCLQEMIPVRGATGQLRQAFPGWHLVKGGDVAVLSRYPITRVIAHPVPGSRRVMLETTVRVRGTRLTVVAVHYATSYGHESLGNPRGTYRRYLQRTADIRGDQTRQLRRLTAGMPTPLVIAGDFNTPPRGVVYRRITQRYPDAFRRAGWGLADTYPARLPVLRIDHIFVSRDLAVLRCGRARTTASDHYPIVADLCLPR